MYDSFIYLKKMFSFFFIVISLYSFAWPRCNHFCVLEYKSWQVCVQGKDSAFFFFLPLLTILFNALSVVGDIVRDSLLQNNDVDSFAQKYLRWRSQQCKNDLPPLFYVGNTLNINLLWCTAIKQGTVRNADGLSFFPPPPYLSLLRFEEEMERGIIAF